VRFEGFGERVVDFYEGLAADNSKAYWTDHRAVYDGDVRAPMEALLAELAEEFAEFGEAKVFRPYRDVRFSRDKAPYKTHCGGVIERGRGGGACYVQVGADGMMAGGGAFHLQPDQLARYRQAVADGRRGENLRRVLAGLAAGGWEIRGETLRTRPRDYPADHPRLDLLRHRSVYAVRRWPPDDLLHERGCLDRVREGWRALRPFNEWVADHVGVSERVR
jgi:uncharacterized protein (TIGR02453 family)